MENGQKVGVETTTAKFNTVTSFDHDLFRYKWSDVVGRELNRELGSEFEVSPGLCVCV